MPCKKCKTMMRVKSWKEYAIRVIYFWKCPKCGYAQETSEDK